MSESWGIPINGHLKVENMMIIHLVLGIFRQKHMLSIRIIWILRLRVSRIFNIFKQSQIDTWELMDIWWCVCACKVKDWRAPREREKHSQILENHQTTKPPTVAILQIWSNPLLTPHFWAKTPKLSVEGDGIPPETMSHPHLDLIETTAPLVGPRPGR